MYIWYEIILFEKDRYILFLNIFTSLDLDLFNVLGVSILYMKITALEDISTVQTPGIAYSCLSFFKTISFVTI